MRVEIRPIEVKKWHGKKGKESFTRPKTIEALVDPETMKYKTGLTEEDVELLKEKGFAYDISDNFTNGVAHPFWESKAAQVRLENQTMILHPTKNPMDFIKVRICRASKFVANSMEELEKGMWPDATHVIFDESAEVEIKATKTATKKKAIIESAKLNKEHKIQLVMILSGKDLRGKSDNHVEVALDELIETQAKQVLQYINGDKEETAVHALVLMCIENHILVKRGHKIEYKGSDLGGDEMEVTHYLMKDANQDLRLRLEAELEN